jgi:hypothetical protein
MRRLGNWQSMVPAIDRAHAPRSYALFSEWTMLLAKSIRMQTETGEPGCGCIPGEEQVDPSSPDHAVALSTDRSTSKLFSHPHQSPMRSSPDVDGACVVAGTAF